MFIFSVLLCEILSIKVLLVFWVVLDMVIEVFPKETFFDPINIALFYQISMVQRISQDAFMQNEVLRKMPIKKSNRVFDKGAISNIN